VEISVEEAAPCTKPLVENPTEPWGVRVDGEVPIATEEPSFALTVLYQSAAARNAESVLSALTPQYLLTILFL
jgi:hypothetical protein